MRPDKFRARDCRATAALCGALLAISLAAPAQSQWLHYKTPGIPRTADGKPRLSAPAPRTADGKPDLSGLWRIDAAGLAETGKAEDAVRLQSWAEELLEKRKETLQRDSPDILCLPPGPIVDMGVGKVVQGRSSLVMLWGGTLYREIFLDGRPLPQDPNPDWMGYSVGHWEGDTLVIETAGFNDRTWLDGDGRPHTEALHVTERLRRKDFGHLEVTRTMVDPGALLEPWTVPVKLELNADTEQLEYVCNENERDHEHLVGKASDEKGIAVPVEVLTRYVGDYQWKVPTSGQLFVFSFRLNGDHLDLTGIGATLKLVSTSETEFAAPGLTLRFPKTDSGTASEVYLQTVEGDFKALRK